MGKPKKGQHRIDAALDALALLGFARSDIRKSVKQLLKVYGRDDGWIFIEEASYKLVIENLLEEQEKKDKEEETNKKLPEDPMQEDKPNDVLPEEPSVQVETPTVAPPVTISKRPPCYDWISESDSESEEEAKADGTKCQTCGGLKPLPSGNDPGPSNR